MQSNSRVGFFDIDDCAPAAGAEQQAAQQPSASPTLTNQQTAYLTILKSCYEVGMDPANNNQWPKRTANYIKNNSSRLKEYIKKAKKAWGYLEDLQSLKAKFSAGLSNEHKKRLDDAISYMDWLLAKSTQNEFLSGEEQLRKKHKVYVDAMQSMPEESLAPPPAESTTSPQFLQSHLYLLVKIAENTIAPLNEMLKALEPADKAEAVITNTLHCVEQTFLAVEDIYNEMKRLDTANKEEEICVRAQAQTQAQAAAAAAAAPRIELELLGELSRLSAATQTSQPTPPLQQPTKPSQEEHPTAQPVSPSPAWWDSLVAEVEATMNTPEAEGLDRLPPFPSFGF